MKIHQTFATLIFTCFQTFSVLAQQDTAQELLSFERIYNSREFSQERLQPIQWIENGAAYVTVENGNELSRWDSKTLEKTVLMPESVLQSGGKPISIESF